MKKILITFILFFVIFASSGLVAKAAVNLPGGNSNLDGSTIRETFNWDQESTLKWLKMNSVLEYDARLFRGNDLFVLGAIDLVLIPINNIEHQLTQVL